MKTTHDPVMATGTSRRRLVGAFVVLSGLALLSACAVTGRSAHSDTPVDRTSVTTSAPRATTTTVARSTTTDPALVGVTAADYVQAFTTSLSSGDPRQNLVVVTPDQAACLAPKFVAAIGVDTLVGHGVTPEAASDPTFDGHDLDLDVRQGYAMYDAFAPCGVDLVERVVSQSTRALTTAQQACALRRASPKLVRRFSGRVLAGIEAGGEYASLVIDLQQRCNLPDDWYG